MTIHQLGIDAVDESCRCTTAWEFDGLCTTGEDWSCIPTELARRVLRNAGR